jgi:hypothetical protein
MGVPRDRAIKTAGKILHFARVREDDLNVIAGQRVGAKRRPMPGSAKQSSFCAEAWIASS